MPKRLRMITVFQDKYPLVGPVLWLLSMQYFVMQIVVALAWAAPFSLRYNTISDLANTACGQYGQRYVCSPLHGYMNASFIVLGLFIIAGAVLIYQEFRQTAGSFAGFSAMGLAGLGSLLVGLFPENTISAAHIAGAALTFVFGNLAMVALGSVLRLPAVLRLYTVASGIVALTALGLFLSGHTGPFGTGGMERVTAYPQTIWLILFGLYVSGTRKTRRKA